MIICLKKLMKVVEIHFSKSQTKTTCTHNGSPRDTNCGQVAALTSLVLWGTDLQTPYFKFKMVLTVILDFHSEQKLKLERFIHSQTSALNINILKFQDKHCHLSNPV